MRNSVILKEVYSVFEVDLVECSDYDGSAYVSRGIAS